MTEDSAIYLTYTITEVSKMIDAPTATIRTWEKKFAEAFQIPRDKEGRRYYTDFEVEILRNIKALREKSVSVPQILKTLIDNKNPSNDEVGVTQYQDIPTMTQNDVITTLHSVRNLLQGFGGFENFEKKIIESNNKNMESLLIKDRTQRFDERTAERRVTRRLEDEAEKLWEQQPEDRRMIKTGWFRKATENLKERDRFVRSHIDKHFDNELKKEFGL